MNTLSDRFLRHLESLLYGKSSSTALLLALSAASLFLAYQAIQLRPDAGFEKNIPRDHPNMQVLRQYHEDFGGANSVLVALMQEKGDIYNADFFEALETATTEVTFIPGIDRTRVASLFTRNVSFIEVDEEGFAGDNVVPPDFSPSPEMFAKIRINIAKAGLIGQLVSLNQRGAMISTEVLSRDPVSGLQPNLVAISNALENQVRMRLTQPKRYQLISKIDLPGFPSGSVASVVYQAPNWSHRFRQYPATYIDDKGHTHHIQVSGRHVAIRESSNPDYLPGLSVHILGFTSIVGAVAGATAQVLGFFLLTILMTMLVLRWYLGSARLAVLPLICALIAVIWEFGLLSLAGFGLDPFAILVPFLVMAVSTSHGVQYVNRWADEIADGHDAREASRLTFRRLFIPGTIAILTNIAGFLTISLIPIDALREMSINASLGMLALLVSNKLLMPVALSHMRIGNVEAFQRHRQQTEIHGDKLWRHLAKVTYKPVALSLIFFSFVVLLLSLWLQQDRIIGDAQTGVPELRPDSVYNQDVAQIAQHFSIGTDVLKIIGETPKDACIDHSALQQVDDFAWRMRNVEGVTAVISVVDVAKNIYAAMNENNPNFMVLPRNRYSLVLATTPIESSSGLLDYHCTAMPIIVFARDHKAATIDRIVSAAKHYNQENQHAFFASSSAAQPEQCEQRQQIRRNLGEQKLALSTQLAILLRSGLNEPDARQQPEMQAIAQNIREERLALEQMTSPCPVNFAIGTGNLAVMAATNEVVEAKEWPALLWVYAVVFALLLLSYRSWRAWLVIGTPLFMVSIFANAVMAQLGIGLKVATLPVVTLAVGIGVDYGIYIYDVLQRKWAEGAPDLYSAYRETLAETGKAVIFTGVVLAGSVATWLFSGLQFQKDMGLLLVFMFTANMLGAVILCPAFYRFILPRQSPQAAA
ncbi:MAG: efflux RND transporter permease subunit [Oceanococcus sp.]